MSETTAAPIPCGRCAQPLGLLSVWLGVVPYHLDCVPTQPQPAGDVGLWERCAKALGAMCSPRRDDHAFWIPGSLQGNSAITAELRDRILALANERDELEQRNMAMLEQCTKDIDLIAKMRDDKAVLKAERNELRAKLTAAEAEIERLEAKIDRLETAPDESLEGRVREFRDRLACGGSWTLHEHVAFLGEIADAITALREVESSTLERAAKACEAVVTRYFRVDGGEAAYLCVAAIRALLPSRPNP